MNYATIGPIAIHLPEKVETNEQLHAEYPKWDMDLIMSRTGIARRHIAADDETAADLGVAACERLFADYDIDPKSIDFLLLCTQTPDYPLPTTACLMQDRLGMRMESGALDFNLGCSGFVYGLALADGLIRSSAARRVLLVTAETYSKYIHPSDRSLRTIFGDAAAATLVEPTDEPSLFGFKFGTDGSGADTLFVTEGGTRPEKDALVPRHRKRWPSPLYMDGPSLMSFSIARIPPFVEDILTAASLTRADIDLFLLHQATLKMLLRLQEEMGLNDFSMPISLENYGNTVSATIPILIQNFVRRVALNRALRVCW